MRNYLLYILLIICSQFALCKDQSTNTKDIENYDISEVWESISKSKDHQVYISFLNDFPYSEYFDTALVRYFEFKQNFLDTIRLPDWDCFRDCIKVEVDSVGGILFENDTINLQTLRKAVLNQLINPNHDRYLPSKKTITDDTGVEREISKGFISPNPKGRPDFQRLRPLGLG
ncbi:MAG: hypothetical protein B6I20_06880 [Bacteroidetes bacterium 4572_117]|nr:MAG: hypothetical protein B6I20_06880 [Bacteroidetes bacterium 4572_117]